MGFGMDMAVQRGYFEAKKYLKVAKWHAAILDRPANKRALDVGGAYERFIFELFAIFIKF